MTTQQGGKKKKAAGVTFSEPEPGPGRLNSDIFGKKPSARAAGGSTGSRGFCCGLFGRRGGSSTFKQNFVVLRHSERRDYVDPTYKTSEEGQAWPHDAPLTPEGVKLAKDVAEELAKLHEKAQFVTIACSPYRRCMETAAEVAARLRLPVVIDQEIGEVRDRTMPQDHIAHRSTVELNAMAKDLKLRLVNPILEDGGVKIFGKPPQWPETLEDAKNRYVVRMETYIRKSAEEQQNMIIVTHADAVAAALVMFERGGADVQNMGFCARVIASRDVKDTKVKGATVEHGVFAEQWAVEVHAVGAEIMKEDGAMAKYYEKLYLERCEETQEMVAKRKNKRTKTDMMFDSALKDMGKFGLDDEDDEDEEEKAEGAAKEEAAAAGQPGDADDKV